MFTSADPPLVPQYSFASPGVEVRRSRAESGGSEYFRARSVSRQRLALQGRGAARAHLANVRGNRRTGQDQLARSRPRRPHQRSRFELVGARRRRALRALSGSRRYPALLRRKALVSAGVSACECAAQKLSCQRKWRRPRRLVLLPQLSIFSIVVIVVSHLAANLTGRRSHRMHVHIRCSVTKRLHHFGKVRARSDALSVRANDVGGG